ncbi:hypothetical protein GCM10027456_52370 [Kineosporia babensis]
MPRRSTWKGREVGSGGGGTCESLGGPGGLSETAMGMKSGGFDHSASRFPHADHNPVPDKLESPP